MLVHGSKLSTNVTLKWRLKYCNYEFRAQELLSGHIYEQESRILASLKQCRNTKLISQENIILWGDDVKKVSMKVHP